VNLYEIIGYSGSILVAVSLMMTNIIKLRKVNLIGASTFAVYGFLVNAYPVLVLNSFIALVDLYYLVQMYRRKDAFSLMPVLDSTHPYLNKFLAFYKSDIQKFSPEFNINNIENANFYFVLRNLVPVGIFIYKVTSPGEAEILLDYAIPDYRDHKNAEFLYYAEAEFLRMKGITKLIAVASVKEHKKYLSRIGFKDDYTKDDRYTKQI
jgi:hypothetical protein